MHIIYIVFSNQTPLPARNETLRSNFLLSFSLYHLPTCINQYPPPILPSPTFLASPYFLLSLSSQQHQLRTPTSWQSFPRKRLLTPIDHEISTKQTAFNRRPKEVQTHEFACFNIGDVESAARRYSCRLLL